MHVHVHHIAPPEGRIAHRSSRKSQAPRAPHLHASHARVQSEEPGTESTTPACIARVHARTYMHIHMSIYMHLATPTARAYG